MFFIKSVLRNLILVALALALPMACALSDRKTLPSVATNPLPAGQTARQGAVLAFSLLSEWTVGGVNDMSWSPDSKIFAVNYSDVNANHFVQAFSVEPLKSIWISEKTLAWDLTFTPDGHFIVESGFGPFFYWRSIERGEVVRHGEFTDIRQTKPRDCDGGGQIILPNAHENTALLVDYRGLIGPSWRSQNIVVIRQLDLKTGKCKELFNYQGSFDLFDLNFAGTLLAYGGVGGQDSVVIRDMERQTEVCRAPAAEFGRFVPGGNMLAVVREQKTVFIDAPTCQDVRELSISPASNYENYLAFSPDGKQFAIAGEDSIQILDTSTGEILAQMPFPEKAIPSSTKFFLSGMKFSPNGRFLLVAYYLLDSADKGKIQLWQLRE